MIPYLLLGATFGIAAAAQPGPMQAYLIWQSASYGWRRALPAAFSPLVSDAPIILTTLVILSQAPAWFMRGLRVGGGAFILYLAYGAFRTWRRGGGNTAGAPTRNRSLWQGALVNLLNPNPWISWSLVLGPLLLEAWRGSPARGIGLLAGFYGVLIPGLVATAVLGGAAGKVHPLAARTLAGVSAAALAIFGGYLLWSAA